MSTSSSAGPPARARDRNRLSDHDKSIIGQAHQLVSVPGLAVRACSSATVVSYADTAHAYAEALSQATKVIGELLVIIERLAGGGAGVTTDSERGEPLARAYEITFTGQAGQVLRAAFDDCALTVGPATTTLRAHLPDQAALWGLVQRIIGLGLEVVDLHVVPPEQW